MAPPPNHQKEVVTRMLKIRKSIMGTLSGRQKFFGRPKIFAKSQKFGKIIFFFEFLASEGGGGSRNFWIFFLKILPADRVQRNFDPKVPDLEKFRPRKSRDRRGKNPSLTYIFFFGGFAT